MICAVVFAYAKSIFSHDTAHIFSNQCLGALQTCKGGLTNWFKGPGFFLFCKNLVCIDVAMCNLMQNVGAVLGSCKLQTAFLSEI